MFDRSSSARCLDEKNDFKANSLTHAATLCGQPADRDQLGAELKMHGVEVIHLPASSGHATAHHKLALLQPWQTHPERHRARRKQNQIRCPQPMVAKGRR